MKEEFEAYTVGLVSMSICTNIESRKKIEEIANIEEPTGISSRWEISPDEIFASGQSNPCPCEQKSGFKHYLMHC